MHRPNAREGRDLPRARPRRRSHSSLKAFGISWSTVLDVAFGWCGTSKDAIQRALTLAENETGKARRRDIASDGKAFRQLIGCAKTGVKLAKDGVFEDNPAAEKRILLKL
jgi:hypothetical protein